MMRRQIVSLLLFLLCAVILFMGFNSISSSSSSSDLSRVEDSLRKGIIECYAIEGKYPESLDYLRENYGVYFDEESYQLHYRYLGANMMPELMVFEKGGK
ncbi:MAG: hypothetical protein Q4D13_07055 [Erysipelotrichaceae bacterium]|nr:hypothetical protein [Erysipelotrichaceae bacterium]